MIETKSDLKQYLYEDEIARFGERVSYLRKVKSGAMWRFHVHLRKYEYYMNCRRDILGKSLRLYHKIMLKKLGMKLGWCIPANCTGPGLCIVHYGPVVINDNARIGSNCRIHVDVNIGANGDDAAPTIGDNVYIAPGAKIFGDIVIASNSAIGANAVVNKSFPEKSVTLVGVPARVVSREGSRRFIKNPKEGKI